MAQRDSTILNRMKQRFKDCLQWEGPFRQRFKEDMRFLYADSDNQEQWNASVRAQRQISGQVMVTINKTHTHWLHVVNQNKENKPEIQVSPTGDESSYESAQIFEQIIKRIEYISDAQTAYDIASGFQVGGGIGYWRLVTEYRDEDSFDQEIFIKQIADPLSVYIDPLIKNQDGSDARYAFVFSDMPRADAEKKYGKLVVQNQDFGDLAENWMRTDSIRVAEYYERNESKEWMYAVPRDDDSPLVVRESEMPPEGKELLENAENVQKRRVSKWKITRYLVVGDNIVDRAEWAGKYIPIIRVPGEEITIENRLDRKGLVRYLKDAARAYNYNASAALEFGALQSKTPYMAPVEAIEGLENYWASANSQNHAFLPYNHADEAGNPIPTPQRQQPPVSPPVFMEGMQAAEHEMMMASGQYEATFSAQGNEISGVSIEQRQKQGERVTFHYQDNLAKAIRFTGKQLIDLIPKIYDTKRIIRIMDESGEEQSIQVDPKAKQALQQQEDQAEAQVAAIFNPNVGNYDVVAKCGPNYDTRREKAFEAMTQLLAAQPALANVIGDLYMGSADFPSADKLQERMRNWIASTNPGALSEGPDPQLQAAQQQMQQMGQMIQHLQTQLQDKTVVETIEKQRADMDALEHLAVRMENERKGMIDAFKAETDRLKAVAPAIDPSQLSDIIKKAVGEIISAPNPDTGIGAAATTYADGIQNSLKPIPALEQMNQQDVKDAAIHNMLGQPTQQPQ
jgi:hypothetical protein